MGREIYLYSAHPPLELEVLVDEYKKAFETELGDLFSDEDLVRFERQLDELATLDVQPRLESLSLDDFAIDESARASLAQFFEECRAVICLENVPFLENNPFQVSYLRGLLRHVGPLLVDLGGLVELMTSEEFLSSIARLRSVDALVPAVDVVTKPRATEPTLADLLLVDVYRELDRLEGQVTMAAMSERQQRIFVLLRTGRPSAVELLKLSGLNPKDFGDGLESLKFFLKRQV